MRIEFDRDTCIGMFQCVAEWDGFKRDEDAGKAVLVDGESLADLADPPAERHGDGDPADVFVREVPAEAELDAKFAARACPVDAIAVYDDDGERLIP